MASSIHHSRRNSIDLPPAIADLIRLKNEFTQFYERDYPELQQCIQRLHGVMRKFEEDFRHSTKGSRDAGVMGIAGGSIALAGLGFALSPLTMGTSLVVASGAAAGVATVTVAAIKGSISRSEKKIQITQFRQNIEEELKTFKEKINPMNEKMKDIHEHTEKIMSDFKKLQQETGDLGIYFDSPSNIWQEDIHKLRAEMSGSMQMIETIAAVFGNVRLLLDMISVFENNRALDDMGKLAENPIDVEIDESEMKTKAGKFIAGMRNAIHQLQNIIDELEKTKDMMANI